jgi:hypothetical protein
MGLNEHFILVTYHKLNGTARHSGITEAADIGRFGQNSWILRSHPSLIPKLDVSLRNPISSIDSLHRVRRSVGEEPMTYCEFGH